MLLRSIAGALALSALAYGIIQANGTEYETALNLLTLTLFCFSFLMLYAISLRGVSVLTLAVCLYHIIFLIVPGMVHSARGQFPFYSLQYSDNSATAAAALLLIYAFSFVIGFVVAPLKLESSTAAPATERAPIGAVRALSLSAAGALISAVSIMTLGGAAFVRHNYYEGVDAPLEFSPGVMILLNLPRMFMFLVACVAIRFLVQRVTYLSVVNVIAIAPILLFVDNPTAITRFHLFAYLIALLVLFAPSPTRFGKLVVATIAIGAVATIFPYIDFLRRGDSVQGFVFDPLSYYTGSGDFDGFQSLINIVDMIDAKGLSYGAQLLGSLLTFVPREIWPSKPYATGQIAADNAGYEFTNISAPLPGELFADFGWLGLAIGAVCIGWAVKALDRRAHVAKVQGRFGSLLVYGGIIGFSAIVFRGSLLGVLAQVYVYFLSTIAVRFIARV